LSCAQVQYEGVDYNLRVLELQPAPAVSVIETDIAADVGPSIETEGYLRAQAEAAAREAERQRQAQEQAEREAAEVGPD
jgi:ubiquitin fusion degradation protein 1